VVTLLRPRGCAGSIAIMRLRHYPLVAVVVLVIEPGSAMAQEGSFNQLTGERGCVVQVGSDSLESCARAPGLASANAVAVSPDQRHVYVAAGGSTTFGSNAVVTFARSPENGALQFVSCVSDSGGDGRIGTDGRCEDGDALLGANDIAVTPDGRFVYVSSGSSGLAWFERTAETGRLVQRGCIRAFGRGDRCGGAFGLSGASSIDVSPDGTSVYATGHADGTVVSFARDATSGALTTTGCISDNGSDGLCLNGIGLADASQVTVAPDGADVYVTSQAGAITGYRRDLATGRLQPNVCLFDLAPSDSSCRSGRALSGAADVAVSPDGRSVFVASSADWALAVLSRDPATGDLRPDTCFVEDESDLGLGGDEDEEGDDARAADVEGCRPAMSLIGASSVVVAADGRSVFVSSPDDVLAAFRRDPASGRLEQFACAEDIPSFDSCVNSRGIAGSRGLAVSSDSRNLYLANPLQGAVAVFSATVAISSRRAALRSDGSIRLRLLCPKPRRAGCAGRVSTRLAGRRRPYAVSGRYRLRAGSAAAVRVRLARDARRRVGSRGRAVLQVLARERRGDVRRTARLVTVR
jgi:6-phosphogluconolactonase (cycloisomerase 2 family)